MIAAATIKRTNRPHSARVPGTVALVQFGRNTVIHILTADGLALEIKTILPPGLLSVRPADTTTSTPLPLGGVGGGGQL